MNWKKHQKVAVGGTFDKLHKGHKKLIDKALEIGEFVVLGLTTDSMLRVYTKPHRMASYYYRKRVLVKYLTDKGARCRFQIMPIDDPYGPTLNNEGIEALVVSHETANRAQEINDLREKRGLKPLKIVIIDMVLAEDAVPISTTRVRNGEIDQDGQLLPYSKQERGQAQV